MANAFDDAEATRLLNASLGISAYTAPTTPMKLALMSTTGTRTATGTEVTGGSYARQSLASSWGTASAGAIASNAAVSFTGMPATTTNGAEIFDSNGTPRRCMWAALTAAKTTASGDTLTFASGAITASNNN